MNKIKRKFINILNALLVLMLCASFTLSNVGVQAGSSAVIRLIGSSLQQVDNVDVGDIRSAFYNSDVIEEDKTAAVSYDGDRWVVVELGEKTLYSEYEKSNSDLNFSEYVETSEGQKLNSEIEAQHERFLASLDREGIDYELKYSYTVLNNGVAIKIDSDAYNSIKEMSSVLDIAISETYNQPKVVVENDANVYTTGIYDSSDITEKGSGMVVAVLDTGLDYTHEAFQNLPADKSKIWTKETVAQKMTSAHDFKANATVDEVYYSEKIPFAYDYADDDADVFPSYSSHGTHVAGIVAGKSDYVVNEETGETFIGVAPEAQLVICKVFTDNLDSDSLGGADTMDIIAAVSDCVALGVDVINMSLGSSAGFAVEGDGNNIDRMINEVYAKVKEAGISLVCAASNDYSSGFGGGNGTNLATNPDSGTVGSPSTYDASLSVASINGQKSTYIRANGSEDQIAFITESSDGNGNELNFVEQLYKITNKKPGETMRFKYVVVGGVGRSSGYSQKIQRELADTTGYDGAIALVKRGDTTFADKVLTAMSYGATACIVYNNLSGTIKMSLGEVENPIPTASISMDAGKSIVDGAGSGKVGYIEVNSDFKAGPFMSDFSSWGPMPNLELKPEITAHGGEITSAVAGGYDIYSGTSMASPNMAGAIALLRQNLKERFPDLKATQLTAMVNQVLMSTATIALNENNNPYSPRKQGAGLASIANAISTESYITVKDANGKIRDKTKIELYDDKNRTGVYEFSFTVNNISDKSVTYNPKAYVMTETLASDNKTVAEKAYMLSAETLFYVNGAAVNQVTVEANGSVEVKVKITLGNDDKSYIEKCFANGMYVEGFVSLVPEDGKVTIGLPFLGFYGDWNDAPLFDYSVYEIAENQQDTSVDPEDKIVASAAETRPLGRYYEDKYILTLGSYLYSQSETDVKIYAEQEKAAISIYDENNNHTIYELYMVYAGLLRGANTMQVTVTDTATGEVVYSELQEKVSKSYAAGGSNRGAAVVLDINALDWNLSANSTYKVSLKGTLDYDGGENPDRGEFDFTFTVDYEAPQVLDYRIRFDQYTENKKIKYRVYMDVDVQDNQFVQDVMPCYVKQNKNGENVLTLATKYPVAVYGQKGEMSTVSFEITDFYNEIIDSNKSYDGKSVLGQFLLVVEDYAMNQSTYRIDMSAAMQYPDAVAVSADGGKLVDTGRVGTNSDGSTYSQYNMTMAPNELYAPVLSVGSDSTKTQTLAWFVENDSEYVMAKEGELFAVSEGNATVVLKDRTGAKSTVYAKINITVAGEPKSKPVADKITLDAAPEGSGNYVNLDNGITSTSLELNPGQTTKLKPSMSPWYITGVTFSYVSDDPDIAKVDENGLITAVGKGTAYITVSANGITVPRKDVKVVVNDIYRIVNYTLYDYYGGPVCEIPKDKNVMYLDEDCFKNNKTLTKIILPSTLTEIPENAFVGCDNLEEVVITGQCNVVGKGAFKGLTKLKTLTFGTFVDRDNNPHEDFNGSITIGHSAFEGCIALTAINNPLRITSAYDRAFAGCTALESVDISELTVTGKQVFADCTSLKTVTTTGFTQIGKEMFKGCTSLTGFDYSGTSIGNGAFEDCKKLTEFNFTGTYETIAERFKGIGQRAFADTALGTITLPNGTYTIGDYAFENCKNLSVVKLSDNTVVTFGRNCFNGATAFVGSADTGFFVANGANGANANYAAVNGVLYSADKNTLISVPAYTQTFDLPSETTELADGALSGVKSVNELDLARIAKVGKYVFADSNITKVTFGNLTSIPDGLFANCGKLTAVEGLNGVTKVGKLAFSGCSALASIELPSATVIEERAFEQCRALTSVSAAKLTSVGDYAFSGANIVNARFPALTAIGSYAFANNDEMLTVELGGVTQMGDHAFYNSNEITSAVFGDGTTIIGAYAFYSARVRSQLRTVELQSGVEIVGDYAFYNCTALNFVDLSNVKTIGDYAFYNDARLANVNLKSVEIVGDYAFAETKLVNVVLDNATQLGDYAFADNKNLTSVTFGALQYLGSHAFSGTGLTTVTLPASFDSTYVKYRWNEYDEKGRVSKERERNVLAYGAGAFANIRTLTEIIANGNNITSIDGVLYAKVNDGYTLLQYPAGKTDKSYVTADNTVSIAANAFEHVEKLEDIEFAYTVNTIGSYAFYDSKVKNYKFNSVKAPALLATYVDGSKYGESEAEYAMFETYRVTIFYANFKDFVAKRMYYPGLFDDFGLTAVVPKNGTGYDSVIWKNFFTIQTTENPMPTDETNGVIKLIDNAAAMMTVDEINAATDIDALKGVSEAVTTARLAYNVIRDSNQTEQIALLAESFAKLVNYETALRAKKADLGHTVAVSELVIETPPAKTRYNVGESFDDTGMKLKLVFEDKSELYVTDYKTDKAVFANGDTDVVLSCEYEGKTYRVTLMLNVNYEQPENPDPTPTPDPEPTPEPEKPNGLPVGGIVGIVIGCVAVAAAAVVAVIVIVKKKKNN